MHTACGCGLSLVNNHFLKKKAETHAALLNFLLKYTKHKH